MCNEVYTSSRNPENSWHTITKRMQRYKDHGPGKYIPQFSKPFTKGEIQELGTSAS